MRRKNFEDSKIQMFYDRSFTVNFFLQVHQGIKGMVLDENNNNLPKAVISVNGINHDVTSGGWPLPSRMRRKLLLLLLQHNQEANKPVR